MKSEEKTHGSIAPCPICGTVPQVQDAPEFGENEFVICCCGVGMSSTGRQNTIMEWNKYIAEYPLKMEEQYMEKKISFVVERLREMLISKNQNYGNSAFTPPVLCPKMDPEQALLVRMSDKVARLAQLTSGEKDRVGESIEDTLYDLAGYCILAIIAMKEDSK